MPVLKNETTERGPSVWLQVLALIVLFLGGGIAGSGLTQWLAPDSILAAFFGLFAFPLAFMLGMQSWVGLAIGIALWRTATRGPLTPAQRRTEVPAGSFVFVPIAVTMVGGAGLLIGLLGSSLGVLATFGLYVLLGLGYGTACWLCARSGYLPWPTE
jgi:hypothetical protein